MFVALGLCAAGATLRAEVADLKVIRAVADHSAHTITVMVANLDTAHLSTPGVWLTGASATVINSTVDPATGIGTLVIAAPNPAASLLLEVSWGNNREDDDHTFEITLGAVGPQGAQGTEGPQGAPGPEGPAGPAGDSAVQFLTYPIFGPMSPPPMPGEIPGSRSRRSIRRPACSSAS